MKRFLTLGLGLLIIPACWSIDTIDSEDVNEDVIYGEYSVSYDAQTADLRYYAQFRVGGATGTTLRLTDPSEVAADGKTMELFDGDEAWLNVEGSYYYLKEAASMASSEYSIVWTRLDGSTYENIVIQADAIEVLSPMDGDTISLADGVTVEFDPPVGDNESVRCTISGNSDVESDLVSSGNTCVFTAAELDEIEPGDATIEVRRKLDGEVQNGHDEEGGRLNSYYYSPHIEMIFSE